MLASAKREAFHSSIRNRQVQLIIGKARWKLNQHHRAQVIDSLIYPTNHPITPQQVALLFRWAAQGDDKATILIGNLVIDGLLPVSMIKEYEDTYEGQAHWPIKSEHYLWLIHVLYQHNHFQLQDLWSLIKTMVALIGQARRSLEVKNLDSSSILYQHGLVLFKQILRGYTETAQLMLITQQEQKTNQDLFSCMWFLCSAGLDSQVTGTCYEILNYFVLGVGELKLDRLINRNFLKSVALAGMWRAEYRVRCLAYQLLTNILGRVDDIPEPVYIGLIPRILQAWEKERSCVQVQISYLLEAYISKAGLEVSKHLILEENMLGCLLSVMQATKQAEVTRNCMEILCKFRKIRYAFGFEQKQVKVWYLFSEALGKKLDDYLGENSSL